MGAGFLVKNPALLTGNAVAAVEGLLDTREAVVAQVGDMVAVMFPHENDLPPAVAEQVAKALENMPAVAQRAESEALTEKQVIAIVNQAFAGDTGARGALAALWARWAARAGATFDDLAPLA